MENQHVEVCDCHIGVDRMINEGGSGFLYYAYDIKIFEPKQVPEEKIKCEVGDKK